LQEFARNGHEFADFQKKLQDRVGNEISNSQVSNSPSTKTSAEPNSPNKPDSSIVKLYNTQNHTQQNSLQLFIRALLRYAKSWFWCNKWSYKHLCLQHVAL